MHISVCIQWPFSWWHYFCSQFFFCTYRAKWFSILHTKHHIRRRQYLMFEGDKDGRLIFLGSSVPITLVVSYKQMLMQSYYGAKCLYYVIDLIHSLKSVMSLKTAHTMSLFQEHRNYLCNLNSELSVNIYFCQVKPKSNFKMSSTHLHAKYSPCPFGSHWHVYSFIFHLIILEFWKSQIKWFDWYM